MNPTEMAQKCHFYVSLNGESFRDSSSRPSNGASSLVPSALIVMVISTIVATMVSFEDELVAGADGCWRFPSLSGSMALPNES